MNALEDFEYVKIGTRWVKDPSGIYPKVPWYDFDDVDFAMENAMVATGWPFLNQDREYEDRYAVDIAKMLIKFAVEPDYVELPTSVQGQTTFYTDGAVKIEISDQLEQQAQKNPKRIVRLRSTLAHELSHYLLHRKMFQNTLKESKILCREEDMAALPISDKPMGGPLWIEQQANRGMAALLMPRRLITKLAGSCFYPFEDDRCIEPDTPRYDNLIEDLSDAFLVSRELARYRVEQLRFEATKALKKVTQGKVHA
ncbi:MAG: ImmA/IrrE family metallo-endopeptidase [Elusimicrobia bacterium]|nr:ImmA/IrrE family metallo-endopeptidase [Elusimicrobiota bacterium]